MKVGGLSLPYLKEKKRLNRVALIWLAAQIRLLPDDLRLSQAGAKAPPIGQSAQSAFCRTAVSPHTGVPRILEHYIKIEWECAFLWLCNKYSFRF